MTSSFSYSKIPITLEIICLIAIYLDDIDELRFLLSQSCKLELKDVLYAHNKDSCDLSGKFMINNDCILRFSI